jgi:hypothetical protein
MVIDETGDIEEAALEFSVVPMASSISGGLAGLASQFATTKPCICLTLTAVPGWSPQ